MAVRAGDKLGAALVLAERRKAAQGNLAAEASLFVEGDCTVPSTAATRSSACAPRATLEAIPRQGMGVRAAGDARLTGWWRASSSVNLHGGLRP